jgi:F0F1-type ATP synthase delta subunit
MNEQLLQLQSKVSGILYNPIIHLKDQIKVAIDIISKQNDHGDELIKLQAAMEELELLEDLPHGDVNRVKGFNKIKTRVLKLIKELLQKVS